MVNYLYLDKELRKGNINSCVFISHVISSYGQPILHIEEGYEKKINNDGEVFYTKTVYELESGNIEDIVKEEEIDLSIETVSERLRDIALLCNYDEGKYILLADIDCKTSISNEDKTNNNDKDKKY